MDSSHHADRKRPGSSSTLWNQLLQIKKEHEEQNMRKRPKSQPAQFQDASSPSSCSPMPSQTPATQSTALPGTQNELEDCEQDSEDGEECQGPVDHSEVKQEDDRFWLNDPGHIGANTGSSGQEATGANGKGLQALTLEERAWLLRIPDGLMEEIGIRFHPQVTWRDRVTRFFRRYLQKDIDKELDNHFFFNTDSVNGGWQTVLCTPALRDRTFVGLVKPAWQEAEVSACQVFFQDADVKDIAQKLPPANIKIRQHLLKCFSAPWMTQLTETCGVDIKLLREETFQALMSGFRPLGCRSAALDNNL